MDCPRCNQSTTLRNVRGVEHDLCGGCGGMFLDHGELNKIAEPTDGDLEYSTVHEDSYQHGDAFGPVTCPRCRKAEMKKVEFNIHTDIILDYCERCRGFWLDGKELSRINDEVRELNEGARGNRPPVLDWFAKFIWSLPR